MTADETRAHVGRGEQRGLNDVFDVRLLWRAVIPEPHVQQLLVAIHPVNTSGGQEIIRVTHLPQPFAILEHQPARQRIRPFSLERSGPVHRGELFRRDVIDCLRRMDVRD